MAALAASRLHWQTSIISRDARQSTTGWRTTEWQNCGPVEAPLRNKNHFSGGAGFEYFFVGAHGFGERQLLTDDRAERPVGEAGGDPGVNFVFFRGSNTPQRESADGSAASHEFSRIDGDLAAVADDDDAASRGEELQVVGKVHVGEHFKNDVQAASSRCFQNLFLITRFAVIKNLMRPFAPHQFKALLCSGSSENREAHRAGELHRSNADPAAGTVHQDGFGRSRLGGMMQRMISGSIRNPHARALAETDFFGK